jgi:hypothetical protein
VKNQDRDGMPRELEGFSWAAFLWGGIWALAHRVWIGLLAFVPGLGFIMNIVLGIKGRQWAWRAGAVPSVDRFNKSQRNWVIVWAALFVLSSFGIFPALAIYGVRKYLMNAKRAEALNTLQVMAKGMTACAAQGDLPDTSPPSPVSSSRSLTRSTTATAGAKRRPPPASSKPKPTWTATASSKAPCNSASTARTAAA